MLASDSTDVLNSNMYMCIASSQDPSGSMGAAVHQSLLEREPGLTPGAALQLTGVPVFTPLPGLTYLVLVPANVHKVQTLALMLSRFGRACSTFATCTAAPLAFKR